MLFLDIEPSSSIVWIIFREYKDGVPLMGMKCRIREEKLLLVSTIWQMDNNAMAIQMFQQQLVMEWLGLKGSEGDLRVGGRVVHIVCS